MPKFKLSVIVICINSKSIRNACLTALAGQSQSDDIEILAVSHERMGDDEQLESKGGDFLKSQEHPGVCWLLVPANTTVPQMRTLGITHSQGDIIALLEDDCLVPEYWCQVVSKSHEGSQSVIGGGILPHDYRHLLDWAVFFCEYARFMPPFSGEKQALPGNHVTYKRSILPTLEAGDGFYEIFFHAEWLKSGGRLIADQILVVKNINHWSLRHMTYLPFHHGRAYAGMRAMEFPNWRKYLYAMLFAIIPILKITRLAGELVKRRHYLGKFILSMPWIMIFFISWSFGEFLGYAIGPGHSANEWR